MFVLRFIKAIVGVICVSNLFVKIDNVEANTLWYNHILSCHKQ